MADGEYRWTKLNLNRPWNLRKDDSCYAYYDYVKGGPFEVDGVETGTSVVLNLKIKPTEIQASPGRERHKIRAINRFAALLKRFLKGVTLGGTPLENYGRGIAIVPTPCSKTIDHPDYDDRIERVCGIVSDSLGFTLDSMVVLAKDRKALHDGADRDPRELKKYLRLRDNLREGYSAIVIVDDMITSGCNFVTIKELLEEEYPDIPIFGAFLSRYVY